MSDLWPIALCNVLYKICSKVIANRLKLILPALISPFQSAFVPGRLITDNILVANEVAHFMHNKRDGNEGFMALKLDLSKAYDRMEWIFLRRVMERFGFASSWINMVMQCVSYVLYSFLVLGKPRGLVIPSRGLRQGDPLSHMIYVNASLEDCYQIQDVLEMYGRASGQLVNFTKSSVVFNKNVPEFMREEITSFLEVEEVESNEKYLGLPTYVGRKKTSTFQYIKDNLAKKLAIWQGKLLSGAGKDILMTRVVAQALPTYAMSVFQLTKNFCEDLEQMCARFWWGSTLDKSKIHWKTWKALCNPKEEGGLGFCSLSNFNTAMLAKQSWRVVNNPTSLVARIYKAKYYPDTTFWLTEASASPSFSWRSLFSTREFLRQSSYWQIGNGLSVDIWSDCWVPGVPDYKPVDNGIASLEVRQVSELLNQAGRWNELLIRQMFPMKEAEAILSIPISSRVVDDRVVWRMEKNGKFTVKSAYRQDFSMSNSRSPFQVSVGVNFWKKIWKVVIPNSAKVHIWRVCHNILPSLERLASKRVVLETQIWDNKSVTTSEVLLMSMTRLHAFRFHNSKPHIGGTVTLSRWSSPLVGWYKINVDGSYNYTSKCGGAGFVVRDSLGNFLAGEGRPLQGLLCSEHAEVLGCRLAANFAVEQGFVPSLLELDAQVVIYVNRSANKVAHLMASQASSEAQEHFYFSSSPSFLIAALAAN
ncbi:uncharacterized protein LOC133737669 [Rosa rugosa]|uniref:uncharacterized protein LOC133737669 n=1 Tax=Rosa rugosa TaxID=74645 RepID=UPI002B40EFAB|nr:uncharacterized protein LOC133737669 [Rosa rugosa]